MQQGAIRGRVLRRDGSPAADVVVMIREGAGPFPDIAAVTGDDGAFGFADLAPGAYLVLARLETGETATARFDVLPDAISDQNISLP